MKKIAVLGGGYSGIACAYDLRKQGHEVVLFEKETSLGGLASGFNPGGWDWPLDRAYHHLFATDTDILSFAKELGFDHIRYSTPVSASLYEDDGEWKQFRLDSPISLLRFPLVSFLTRIRAGITLAFLKLVPPLSVFEKISAKEFLQKTMGEEGWKVLWEQLFQKKFGKYAENILSIFIWARVKKRTASLGYPDGGFQALTDFFEGKLAESGVQIRKGSDVGQVAKIGNKFKIGEEEFDTIVSTLPTKALTKVASGIMPKDYLQKLANLKYLHAVNLIIASPQKLLDNNYWLNLCVPGWGAMVAVQHTNYISSEHYGGENILYLAKYIDNDDPLLKASDEEVFAFFTTPLGKINPDFDPKAGRHWVFKAGLAQPIFDSSFPANKPEFHSPLANFFIANLDMTYPYDRGTNYAIKLGREVAKLAGRQE